MPAGRVRNGFHCTNLGRGLRGLNSEQAGVQFSFADIETQHKHKNPQKGKQRVTTPFRSAEGAGFSGLRSCCA